MWSMGPMGFWESERVCRSHRLLWHKVVEKSEEKKQQPRGSLGYRESERVCRSHRLLWHTVVEKSEEKKQ